MAVAGDLALVEAFVNTLDERTFSVHGAKHVPSDALTSPDALAGWLSAHGLPTPRLHSDDLEAAVRLRTALRTSLIGDDDDPALASFPLRLVPDPEGGLRLVAEAGVLGPVVEAVAASVAGGGWNRLKLCASDDCRWAFYDTSRSGGGRWCSMQACGNRHKARAYRRRQDQPKSA